LPMYSWVLTYAFVQDGKQIVVVATDNGDGSHLAKITPVQSATFLEGICHWQAHVDNGTDHHMVDSGRVDIEISFINQTTGFDARSHAEKTLEAIEAQLAGRATKDQLKYTVQGTSIERMPINDLLKFRNVYRNEVKSEKIAEDIANGLGSSRTIKVRI